MIPINRRTFIMAAAVAVAPTLTIGQTSDSRRIETGMLVKANQDRFMRRQTVLGGFPIDSKVSTQDTTVVFSSSRILMKKWAAPHVSRSRN